MHRRRRIIAYALLLLCILAGTTLGRAGGGGGFHGGGGGGGGGGFGGGGGGFHHYGGGGHSGGGSDFGSFGFVVLLIIVVVIYLLIQQYGTDAFQSTTIRQGGAAIDANRKAAILAQLRQHDPAFDEEQFCQRVSNAFNQIQTAWCAQNLKSVQLFLSDGVAERFALQFAEQIAMGYRDQMSQIGIDDIRIADLDTSGIFDEIAVRITAHAVDYRVPLSNKPGQTAPAPPQISSADTSVEPFIEIWSFLRRRGSLTDNSKPGLIEGHCPNCGAAIEINQTAQCQYCKALLHSGQYDWVLSEITQASEWERSSDRQIPGVNEFRQRDPSFDPQALEDRASVIFWRRASADRLGKLDPIRKVAADEFCDSIKEAVVGLSGQPRVFAGECAVGGVELLAMISAENGTEFDRALVKVRWSGKVFTLDANRQHLDVGDDLLRTTALVLQRKATARTDPDKSISSAHCPNCGSPEANSADNKCPNCGTVLNDGSRDWVLTQWLPMTDPTIRQLIEGASDHQSQSAGLAPANAMGLLAWAVKVAAADGTIDPRERAQLNELAAQSSIPIGQLNGLIASALSQTLQLPEPTTPAEAKEWLASMAKIALADGVLDRTEMQLLQTIGSRIGMAAYDIQQTLRRVQAEQVASARAATRKS